MKDTQQNTGAALDYLRGLEKEDTVSYLDYNSWLKGEAKTPLTCDT